MKLTERDLVAIIKSHRDDSLGADGGDLSSKRVDAMDHYHGRPYGTEVAGRSQVVSRDLAEAVDWALPAILRVFVQSGSLGEFDPVGPEDEQAAQQESDYTNQVMMKDNHGFMVLHDAIKETLVLKNGYTKHFWSEEEKTTEESYTGLVLSEVQRILSDLAAEGAQVVITGQDVRSEVIGGQRVELFDVALKITRKCGKCVWIAVPPEEVRVSKKCRGSLQDSPFTEHVTRKTRSELREMGMPAGFVDDLPAWDSDDNDSQRLARDSTTDESDDSERTYDRSMDEIQFCEAYMRVDWDGDGIAELRRIVTCADRIPPGAEWNKPIEAVPMTGWAMKRVPHRHVGESLDDELADLQEIKTVLHRQLLDNVYLTNNARTIVNERVNLKDLLSTTPGGVIRVRGTEPIGDSASPVMVAPVLDKILPAIDYWDRTKESRTGISKAMTGLDPDTLKQSTKGAFLENLNRASQKIEMITRMIAETGVKESFLQVHGILMRHQDKRRMVQMRGKWVEVNPQEWKERTDLTVRVGLGTGNEEEKRQKLLLVTQLQDRMGPHGLVGPNQMYSLFEDISKTLGFDMPERYAMSPNSPEFAQMMQQRQQAPNPEVIKVQEQGKVQLAIEGQRSQLQVQSKQADLQVQAANDARDAEREERRMMAEIELERMRIMAQQEKDRAQIEADERRAIREEEFRRWQAELDAAVKLQQSSMQAQVVTPATQAAGREVVQEVKP